MEVLEQRFFHKRTVTVAYLGYTPQNSAPGEYDPLGRTVFFSRTRYHVPNTLYRSVSTTRTLRNLHRQTSPFLQQTTYTGFDPSSKRGVIDSQVELLTVVRTVNCEPC
jgi:hypothetical protein